MNPQTKQIQFIQRLLYASIIIALVVAAYQLIAAVSLSGITGTLNVVASNPAATLSITSADTEARIIGTGSVGVRLKPGSYLVAAYAAGYQASEVVIITKHHKSQITLQIASNPSSKTTKTSLFSLLPFIGPAAAYQIDSSVQATDHGSQSVIVITSATEVDKQAALAWIHSEGYNPSDYIIQYVQQAVQNYHYTEGLPQ